jgi:hypothetical protein
VASTITVPAPVKVTVEPFIVAGPDLIANVTGNPDDALALTLNGGSPKVLSARAPKLIVWFAFATLKLRGTSAAAL